MQKLDVDATLHIFQYLKNPRDVARIAIVSHTWRHIVMEGRLWRQLCIRQFPAIEMFGLTSQVDAAGCSITANNMQPLSVQSLEAEQLIYSTLCKQLLGKPSGKNCILEPLSASSTDNFPEENISETLCPTPRCSETGLPSYWSSKGQIRTNVPESLTYQLVTRLCLVREVRIRPFQGVITFLHFVILMIFLAATTPEFAYFQREKPIYSAKYVRFRMGYALSSIGTLVQESDSPCTSTTSTDRSPCKDYVWIYTSPEFPMLQDDSLQSFKLPQAVLCIGGILQVELLGRVQKQQMDQLYYICICHVNVVGTPLFNFDFNVINNSLVLLLRKGQSEFLENDTTSTDNSAAGPFGWRQFTESF